MPASGLGHYEGRSWRGWYRHVTCVSVARAFLTFWRREHPDTGAEPPPDTHLLAENRHDREARAGLPPQAAA